MAKTKDVRRAGQTRLHAKNGTIERKVLVRVVTSFTLKASTNAEERTFEGFAATWNQDLGNDVIEKGAFKETIKNWKKSGDALPLLDSHDQWSIMSALGQLVDAQETDKGLWTKWEVLDGPDGDAVLARLRPMKLSKRPIIGKMSIGFFPEEFNFTQPKGSTDPWDRIRHLTKVDLKEVSLVLFPMNNEASIDAASVKSFALSAENTDRSKLDVLTKKQLRRLAGIIGGLLKKDDAPDEEEEDPTPPAPVDKTDLEEVDDENEELDLDDVAKGDDDIVDDDEVDDDDDVEDDTDEDESDESDDADEEKEPTKDRKKKTETKDEPAAIPIYQYSDALKQRIASLNLNQRLEELTNNS